MIGKIISVIGEPGVAEGLINYQNKIDKQREKLRERMEARILAIQKLMISRGYLVQRLKHILQMLPLS